MFEYEKTFRVKPGRGSKPLQKSVIEVFGVVGRINISDIETSIDAAQRLHQIHLEDLEPFSDFE